MKKCPSCQKTFEDNMKFCQSDGTPLVVVAEETPSADPYKTMVASDIKLPDEETAVPLTPEPTPEPAPPAAPESAQSPPADYSVPEEVEGDDVLEIPDKKEEPDPMKTIVVSSSDTSDNIKVPDISAASQEPPAKPARPTEPRPAAPAEPPEAASEAATIITPEIPKFSEPDIKPPDLGISDDPPAAPGEQKKEAPQAEKPAGSDSKPSLPIPSPFEESMPPGVAFPDKPPFEDDVKPAQSEPMPSEPKPATPPASPFADPKAPVGTPAAEDWEVPSAAASVPAVASEPDPFGDNSILSAAEPASVGTEGGNKTLAIVSLVSGILSCLCCFSIITGPVALVTGFMARGKIGEDPGTYGGGTLAMVGMILGVVGIILFLILAVVQFFMGGLMQLQ